MIFSSQVCFPGLIWHLCVYKYNDKAEQLMAARLCSPTLCWTSGQQEMSNTTTSWILETPGANHWWTRKLRHFPSVYHGAGAINAFQCAIRLPAICQSIFSNYLFLNCRGFLYIIIYIYWSMYNRGHQHPKTWEGVAKMFLFHWTSQFGLEHYQFAYCHSQAQLGTSWRWKIPWLKNRCTDHFSQFQVQIPGFCGSNLAFQALKIWSLRCPWQSSKCHESLGVFSDVLQRQPGCHGNEWKIVGQGGARVRQALGCFVDNYVFFFFFNTYIYI